MHNGYPNFDALIIMELDNGLADTMKNKADFLAKVNALVSVFQANGIKVLASKRPEDFDNERDNNDMRLAFNSAGVEVFECENSYTTRLPDGFADKVSSFNHVLIIGEDVFVNLFKIGMPCDRLSVCHELCYYNASNYPEQRLMDYYFPEATAFSFSELSEILEIGRDTTNVRVNNPKWQPI